MKSNDGDSARVTSLPSMLQWPRSVRTRSGIVSSLLPAFGAIECQAFRTTFFIACQAVTSRFLWLHLIVVARAIGSAGSNWSFHRSACGIR